MPRAAEYLSDFPLFAGLDEEESRLIASVAKRKTYPPRHLISLEGAVTDFFGIVTAGLIKGVNYSAEGREFLIDFHIPGELVGEFSITSEIEFPCDFVAVEESEIVFVRRNSMAELARKNGMIALRLATASSLRMMRLHRRLKSVALDRGPERIHAFLTEMALRVGTSTDGGMLVDLTLSHQMLADACGLSRETVSRLMADLVRNGSLQKRASGWMLKTPDRRVVSPGLDPLGVQ